MGLNYDTPFLEQPFRYVASIPVALTPFLQFMRGRVHLRLEAEALDDGLKLGRNRRDGQYWATPIRISASVSHIWECATPVMD